MLTGRYPTIPTGLRPTIKSCCSMLPNSDKSDSQTYLPGTLGPTENSSHLSSCLFFLLNSVADRTSPRHSKSSKNAIQCNSSCRKSIRRPSGDLHSSPPKKSLVLMLPLRTSTALQSSITTSPCQLPKNLLLSRRRCFLRCSWKTAEAVHGQGT